jgi:hypothetical protein
MTKATAGCRSSREPAAAGLAAQPLPHRPGRGRTRLPAGRATRQRQRRRHPAGHHLAVAAQSLHTFIANFHVENYQTGKKTNTFWQAPLTALPQLPYVWLNYWSTAAATFGVDTQGVYLYRPTFTVVVPNPGELPAFIGLSDLAVAEEHFFLVEGYVP